MKLIKNKNRGFTLLEALVAISIVLVAISTTFSIVPQGQLTVRNLRNQLTASYLAQEGIELVRHKRDNGMFFQNNWLADSLDSSGCVSDSGASVTKCIITLNQDATAVTLSVCSSQCPVLEKRLLPSGDYLYGNLISGDPSQFTRWVEISRVVNEEGANWEMDAQSRGARPGEGDAENIELSVKSIVEWVNNPNDTSPKRIVLQEQLFNWAK